MLGIVPLVIVSTVTMTLVRKLATRVVSVRLLMFIRRLRCRWTVVSRSRRYWLMRRGLRSRSVRAYFLDHKSSTPDRDGMSVDLTGWTAEVTYAVLEWLGPLPCDDPVAKGTTGSGPFEVTCMPHLETVDD